jgi:hypothetical protein
MKKVIIALFAISLVCISCTDNTTEHEELAKINSIDKGDSPAQGDDEEEINNN